MERDVTMLLESAAPTAVPPLDLAGVRRRVRRRRAVQVTAAAAAVAVAVPLAVAVAPRTPPDVEFAGPPGAKSRQVVVATFEQGGSRRELVAYESEDGLCVEDRSVAPPHNQGGGCGFDVPEHAVGLGVGATGDGVIAAGPVIKSVADVRVELDDGTTVDAGPIGQETGFDVNFYLAVLPARSKVEAVVAYDAAGGVVERRRSQASPPGTTAPGFPAPSSLVQELAQADIKFRAAQPPKTRSSRPTAVAAARDAAGARAGRLRSATYGTVADTTSTPRDRRRGWVVVLDAAPDARPVNKLPLLRVIVVIGDEGNPTHLIGVTEAKAMRLPVADDR